MMKKWMIYLLLPLQLLILLLSPRFGWKIHSPESFGLPYKGTTYIDGKFHSIYENENGKVDICYEGIFSKQFLITVNDTDEYEMKVAIDGEGEAVAIGKESASKLLFTPSDIVHNDSCGILWWRYILTVAMTIFSIVRLRRANRIQVFPCILYVVSILISFRILF